MVNVDPDGHFLISVFLIIVGVSTLVGAVSGGVSAVRAGQSFWKGFAAGAIAGFIGGVVSGLSGFLGHSLLFSLAGRMISSFAYSIVNEKFQTGKVNWNNWDTYALDAVQDAAVSLLYFKAVPFLAGKVSSSAINFGNISSSFVQEALVEGSKVVATGMFEFGFDNFQFDIYKSTLPKIVSSWFDNFGKFSRAYAFS